MELRISEQAKADLEWFRAHDPKLYKRCFELTPAVQADPYRGIGKPERLKALGDNVWSRRISLEHRMVYEIFANLIVVSSFRYHHDS